MYKIYTKQDSHKRLMTYPQRQIRSLFQNYYISRTIPEIKIENMKNAMTLSITVR